MTSDTKIIGGIVLLAVAILGGIIFISAKTAPLGPIDAREIDSPEIVREDSQRSGSGPIQVVEFGDFQCPACAQAYPVYKQIKAEYGDSISFVFRHLPLSSIHPKADTAARYAEAAGLQGKFWEMHDLLYEKQTEWSNAVDSKSLFESYAKQIGLDLDKLKSDITSQAVTDKIATDKGDANALGLNSTPSTYVNQTKVSNLTYDELKRLIEAAKTTSTP